MTCIAYRFPFIVADQRIVYHDTNMGRFNKLEQVSAEGKTLYMGYSGDVGPQSEVATYIVNDLISKQKNELFDKIRERYQAEKAYETETLCILFNHETKAVDVFEYDAKLYRIAYRSDFRAGGCGYLLALGAMAYGASAWDAVRIACEHSTACGFPIDGYNVVTGEHFEFRDAYELRRAFPAPVKATSANGLLIDTHTTGYHQELFHEPLMARKATETFG